MKASFTVRAFCRANGKLVIKHSESAVSELAASARASELAGLHAGVAAFRIVSDNGLVSHVTTIAQFGETA